MKSKTTLFSVRFKDQTLQQVKGEAKADSRSINGMVNKLVIEALAARKKGKQV